MPLELHKLHTVDDHSFAYILERDVDIPLRTANACTPDDPLLVRANVYRPKKAGRFPVLVTYGPYGKDIPYHQFHADSFEDVNPKQKSFHSAWEVPDPLYWTTHGYVVVRADERGSGNSPGMLDSMSKETCDGFFDVIEWAAEQPWSTGKVGTLGISYYAGTQWRVAARRPKGLACIVPWEGMSDYYQDRVRHGGILSNAFIKFWYDRQVGSNQYGLGGRTERGWGTDSLEGVLSKDELMKNRKEQPVDCLANRYMDDEYFRSRDFDLSAIEIPCLGAANLGAIHLHLRGNVMAHMKIKSQFKYLRFITGRHDLPFFYEEEVALQTSFLDACLKGEDREGWLVPGKVPPVSVCLRKGDPGYNNAVAERVAFPRRSEWEWPIARTQYVEYHLDAQNGLGPRTTKAEEGVVRYPAPEGGATFVTTPFSEETEITGHPVARLSLCLTEKNGSTPSEMDIFLTLRHHNASGKEIFYTGAQGNPIPVVRGWLRLSLRHTTKKPTALSAIIPERDFLSTDVTPVIPGVTYTVDVELWPTNVVVLPGETLALQVTASDTDNAEVFLHNSPEDRPEGILKGWNEIRFGPQLENYLRLPIIPGK